MAGLPGLPPPGFADAMQQPQAQTRGLPGLPPPGFAGQDLTAGQTATGVLGSLAQGLTFGTADEAAAGLVTGADYIGNKLGFGQRFPGGYDQALQTIRGNQAQFAQEHPVADVAGQIGGSLALPLGGLFKGAGLAKTAAASGGLSAAYGFGQGEGGFENRAENAATSGAVGAVAGPAIGAVANKVASGLAGAGDEFERMALNIQRSDLKKADRFAKIPPGEDPKLIQALDGARARGLMAGDRSPQGLIQRNESMISDLGGKVNSALSAADAGQTNIVFPQMRNAAQFIKSNPYEAEKLAAQLENRMNAINQSWDGSVSGLNEMKQQLYRISYNGTAESKALDRAIARDLKEAVEAQAAQFGGDDLAAQIRTLNAQQGENLTLRDILQKGAYNDEMPGGVAKGLQRAVVSPIGGGALGIATGMLTGNPGLAVGSALASGAASRGGQLILSDVSRAAAKAAPEIGLFGNRIAPVVTNLGQSDQTDQDTASSQYRKIAQALATRKTEAPLVSTPGKTQSTTKNSSTSSYNPLSGLPPAKGYEQIATALMENNTSVPGNTGELKQMLDAIKTIESGGNSKAISPKGAKGSFQLMDSLGKEYHRRLGLKDKYNPHDDAQAEKIATAFMADLVRKYGDEKTAAAAYNAGEPAVDRAIRKAGSNKWEDYYFYLPNETRKYGAKYENARA